MNNICAQYVVHMLFANLSVIQCQGTLHYYSIGSLSVCCCVVASSRLQASCYESQILNFKKRNSDKNNSNNYQSLLPFGQR